ncbi:MAG: hypothetical protein L0Y58_17080 [Verrucomicrobia subdivision 3 bacterium]|nr:hypothetical protein [Limisphaerales bacterium]
MAWLWAAVAALSCGAVVFSDDFAFDPNQRGWRRHGNPELFQWNSTNANLAVIWDSRQPNTLFYRPLGTVLTMNDDFNFSFDLRLHDIAIAVDPSKPYTFQIAVGLCRWASITNSNFFRGSGINATYGPRNLVEFNYFPDSGFGATVAPTVVSTNNRIRFSDNHPLELTPKDLYRVEMTYAASNRVLHTFMTRNGEPFGPIQDLSLATFPDFRVDTFAVISYNDGFQSPPQFAGSILAHGVIDNVSWTVPGPPIGSISANFVATSLRFDFTGKSNWVYQLDRSTDLKSWTTVATNLALTTGPLSLTDLSPPNERAVYRVRADRP